MKSLLGWIVALAIVVGGGVFGMNYVKQTRTEFGYQLALAELKDGFKTQSTGLHFLSPKAYTKEIGIHLTRYFSKLRKLDKEFPEQQDFQRELKRGDAMMAKNHLNKSQKEARDTRIKATLDLMDKMRSGQYRPLYTQARNGFRFDIYDIQEKEDKTGIRMSYVHWGAYGPVDYNMIEGTYTAEVEEGEAVQVSQIVGESQPPAMQIKPVRWVTEFPSGMEFGYYDLPKGPADATGIKLSFQFAIRTVGGSPVGADINFPEIPLETNWKVAEGKEWKAQERFASDEELEALGVKPQIVVK